MVIDRMRNVSRYAMLSEGLRKIAAARSCPVPDFHGYRTDRDHTVVFSVTAGEAVFSTSWRENPDSRDAKAVVRASAGDFVLFLPGEPFIMRPVSAEPEISMYVLE